VGNKTKSPFNDPNWRNKYFNDALKSKNFAQMIKELADQMDKEAKDKFNKKT
jgi:hypothetical protein